MRAGGGARSRAKRLEEAKEVVRGEDIGMELLDIEEGACSENWSSEVGSL